MVSKVRAVRLEKGLKQMQVVAMTGNILNQYRLSIIERGVKPRTDEAAALAHALEMNVADLFGE
jgi:transcriptional regulator with XRE-family HTH domain